MADARSFISFICLAMLGYSMAAAQDYPNRPVRINVSEVGGSGDFTARLIGPRIATGLGQSIIVENRASLLTIETVAKAPPDGYNVLITGTAFLTGPLLRKMSYDPIRDFTPISLLVVEPNVLIVHPSLPVKSVKDLIALAKAHPGQLNYAYSSIGSSDHVAMELLKSMTGVSITGIAYKSNMQQTADVMSGEVQMTFQSGSKTTPLRDLTQVREITIETYKKARDNVGSDERRINPASREDAIYSIFYLIAATLIDGTVTQRSFNDAHLWDPRLRALMRKIVIVENPDFTKACSQVPQQQRARITILMQSGDRLVAEAGGDAYDMSAPKSDSEVEAKFRNLTEEFFGSTRVNAILSRLWRLEEIANVAEIPSAFVA